MERQVNMLPIELSDSVAVCNGECLEAMDEIPDGSVDAVITDPPYFIDGMGNNWDVEQLDGKAKKGVVIGSLPVGMKFDPKQGKELEGFMRKVSDQVFRVLKPGGFFISFSQGRLYHRMAVAVEDAGFEVRDMLVWKREGQPKAFSQEHFVRKMDLPEEEKARIVAELGGRKTPQLKGQSEPMVLAQKPKDGTFIENWMAHGVGLVDVSVSLDGKFPGTVMEVEKPSGEERKESSHMTMKPVRLMEHLVRIFTKEGSTVLDPFMGSGSTGVACVHTGRKFFGIELNPKYFGEAKARLEKHIGEKNG